MLRLDLEYLLRLRGITQCYAYLQNHGFTEGEARCLLNSKRKRISFKMITRLCTFFECTPNDLFDWDGDMTHSCASLKRKPLPDLQQLFEGMSPKEILEALRKLSE